jgi:hypothetical protein
VILLALFPCAGQTPSKSISALLSENLAQLEEHYHCKEKKSDKAIKCLYAGLLYLIVLGNRCSPLMCTPVLGTASQHLLEMPR